MSFFNTVQEKTPQTQTRNVLSGVYSNTGFDMIGMLTRLIIRDNPQIQLGPIDMSCSFVVSDARQHDFPVIYCSPGFEKLTGYSQGEIAGRNCRFLQSPDGQVTVGSRRQHTDNQAVSYLKSQLSQSKEHQASIINYKKGGQPFVNLITVIPLFSFDGEPEYFMGLQVDLVEQPNSILERMHNGTYLVNYNQAVNPTLSSITENGEEVIDENVNTTDGYFQESPPEKEIFSILNNPAVANMQKDWNQLVLDQTHDFLHVLSLKGLFLYASNSSLSLLEYEPQELIGKSLNQICHPSDIIPVMREIKDTSSHAESIVNIIYRIRRKRSGYTWIHCRGKLYMDSNRARKFLVLCGREFPVYSLPYSQVNLYNEEYWAKLSLSGLYLHVSESCRRIVGFTAGTLVHESIYQYVENSAIIKISAALQSVKETRQSTRVLHTVLSSKGDYVPVQSTFYPGDSTVPTPSFVLLQVKSIKDNEKLAPRSSSRGNMFTELEVTRSTNWQYELHKLRLSNRRLREEIEKYPGSRKRRERRKQKVDKAVEVCSQCQTRDSPEWRKGPNGPRELCNACGLRFAKTEKLNKK